MDGFAVAHPVPGKKFKVLFTVAAGSKPLGSLREGECAKVMTGAAIPKGAGQVIPVELAAENKDEVSFSKIPVDRYIESRGHHCKKGTLLLAAGKKIRPQELAILASAGISSVKVRKKIRVAVLATGDEVVSPGKKPGPFQIRNSNSPQLLGQLTELGCKARDFGIAPDNKEKIHSLFKKALAGHDAVILTGGVSMGDFDFVPGILKRAGVRVLFDRVSIKPGKPVLFGVKNKKMVFGLPGNPVSSFVIFHLLVKPALTLLSGSVIKSSVIGAPLADPVDGIPHGRLSFRPVRFGAEGRIHLLRYHGSAHIHAYAQADAMLRQSPNSPPLKIGDLAEIVLI